MSRVIVVMGAGGPAGRAVAGKFAELGDTVVGVDKSGAEGCLAVDLLDRDAVRGLAERVRAEHGRVDGVVHLVGGWRGSKTFADTSLDDWDLLHDLLIRTLQNVSLEFEPLLRASGNGRFVIVSPGPPRSRRRAARRTPPRRPPPRRGRCRWPTR